MNPQESFSKQIINAKKINSIPSRRWRINQLKKVSLLIEENEQKILSALSSDLDKPSTEAFFEILGVIQEIQYTEKNLSKWMSSKPISIPLSLQPSSAKVIPEPLGTVLIIGPWNYPFLLTLRPLICALSAGNRVVLKPSEYSPATSKLIKELFSKYFEEDIVLVLEGDGKYTQELLKNNFDHIFFTGGTEIGRKVMKAAAENLTPVTLELGGRNPAIILKDADMDIAGRRLTWGKCLNSGQTCLAPNVLLVERGYKSKLINSIKENIKLFYGKNPLNSKNIAKINFRQYEKTVEVIKRAFKTNQIIYGGQFDDGKEKVAPTILNIREFNDPLIKSELFSPIIPILEISNLDEVINYCNNNAKPLAIYMFGGSNTQQERIIQETSSGSICFNDVILQAGFPSMPFGGVGESGIGRYHGEKGFETFSNQKSVLTRPFWLDIKFRYPPYKLDIQWLKKLL